MVNSNYRFSTTDSMMTPDEFLASFTMLADVTDLRTRQVDDLPSDPHFYLRLATELFPRNSYEDIELRQKFVTICNQLLYRDGRTFHALMHVVKISLVDDEISRNGVNALAGVACYLRGKPLLTIEISELRKIFTSCLSIPRLKNNSLVCLSEIDEQRR